MDNRELYHWGVKGMKWGVRRYQNKDGSLTPAGQKRYDRDIKDLSDKKKAKYTADTDKWVKDDIEAARRLNNETSNLLRDVKNANDRSMRNSKRSKLDLSNMTDQQMRNEINRALLEKQYSDMFAPQKVSKGKAYASKILEGAVTTLGVASSALGIALAIKELRG